MTPGPLRRASTGRVDDACGQDQRDDAVHRPPERPVGHRGAVDEGHIRVEESYHDRRRLRGRSSDIGWEKDMRVVTVVVAGLLLGAVAAFVAALLRPRRRQDQSPA